MKKTNIMENAYGGFDFSKIIASRDAQIYHFQNETGDGEMCCYDLIDGIQLSYNKLNMSTAYQKIETKKGVLQIDHCMDGCYEFELAGKEHAFVSKGDLSVIDLSKVHFEDSCIPTGQYIGLTFFIDIAEAQKSLDSCFPYGNIDLEEIRQKFCQDGTAMLIRSCKEINHIIQELYGVDGEIRLPYSILKMLELFLFLKKVDRCDTGKLPSFSDIVYRATQECYQSILHNPFERASISELATRYAISESSLKRCFVAITGSSIGSFTKSTCLEASAELLLQKPSMTIGEISELSGYLNQGKYSSAFKACFGETPQQYRKNHLT